MKNHEKSRFSVTLAPGAGKTLTFLKNF